MKKLVLTFLPFAFALITACGNVVPWPSSGVFAGYYLYGFEKSDFKPVGTKERWWLSGNIGTRIVLFVAPSGKEPVKVKGPVYAVLRGTLSDEGQHGHLGQYRRELFVEQVIEVRELGPNEVIAF